MDAPVTPDQARVALDAVERGRLRVIDEIGLPRWYWWGLALGWIALGVITDLKNPWATGAVTFAFGAVHASVATRAAGGRRRTQRVSVRAEIAGRDTARIVVGIVAALGCLTVGLAWAADADGARHPVTTASIFIATLIVLGRPQLIAAVRRRAARTSPR